MGGPRAPSPLHTSPALTRIWAQSQKTYEPVFLDDEASVWYTIIEPP